MKDGQIYNWVGSIRERIFSAREGEDAVIREKKKKSVRRNTKTIGERSKMDSPVQRRISRSTNDLSSLLVIKRDDTSKNYHELEVPRINRSLPQSKKDIQGPLIQGTNSPMRSRKFSNSLQSVLSGILNLFILGKIGSFEVTYCVGRKHQVFSELCYAYT